MQTIDNADFAFDELPSQQRSIILNNQKQQTLTKHKVSKTAKISRTQTILERLVKAISIYKHMTDIRRRYAQFLHYD